MQTFDAFLDGLRFLWENALYGWSIAAERIGGVSIRQQEREWAHIKRALRTWWRLATWIPIIFLAIGVMTWNRPLIAAVTLVWLFASVMFLALISPAGVSAEEIAELVGQRDRWFGKGFMRFGVWVLFSEAFIGVVLVFVEVRKNLEGLPLFLLGAAALGLWAAVSAPKQAKAIKTIMFAAGLILAVDYVVSIWLPETHQKYLVGINGKADKALSSIGSPDKEEPPPPAVAIVAPNAAKSAIALSRKHSSETIEPLQAETCSPPYSAYGSDAFYFKPMNGCGVVQALDHFGAKLGEWIVCSRQSGHAIRKEDVRFSPSAQLLRACATADAPRAGLHGWMVAEGW